jgi:protoheme ferro-lyase
VPSLPPQHALVMAALKVLDHPRSLSYAVYAQYAVSTSKQAAEPVARMVRVKLTESEWHRLRVLAAERDSTMQEVVAQAIKREVARRAK